MVLKTTLKIDFARTRIQLFYPKINLLSFSGLYFLISNKTIELPPKILTQGEISHHIAVKL